MFKLLERKGQCLVMLKRYIGIDSLCKQSKNLPLTLTIGRFAEARTAFEEGIVSLKLSKLDKRKREKFLKDTKESLEKITVEEQAQKEDNSSSVQVTKTTNEKNKDSILNIESRNAKFVAASSVIDVKHQKGRGRFAVASKDIPVGTTLVVEQPITWAIHPERLVYMRHIEKKCKYSKLLAVVL